MINVIIPSVAPLDRSLENIINNNNLVILDTSIIVSDIIAEGRVADGNSMRLLFNIFREDREKFYEIYHYKLNYINVLKKYYEKLYFTEEVSQELQNRIDGFEEIFKNFYEKGDMRYNKLMKCLHIVCSETKNFIDYVKSIDHVISSNNFDKVVYDIILEEFKDAKKIIGNKGNPHNNHNGHINLFTDEKLAADSVYIDKIRKTPVDIITKDKDIDELFKVFCSRNGNSNDLKVVVYKGNKYNNIEKVFPSLN